MNVIDFIRESAAFMQNDRSDIYETHGEAVAELSSIIEKLREENFNFGAIECNSFIVTRTKDSDDDLESFLLCRKITGLLLSEEEEDVVAFSYTGDVPGLPHVAEDFYQDELDDLYDDDDE